MTEYIVLLNGELNGWQPVEPAIVKASSALRAVKIVSEDGGAGEYVAIPARSWKPLKVKVEQTTKVTIG